LAFIKFSQKVQNWQLRPFFRAGRWLAAKSQAKVLLSPFSPPNPPILETANPPKGGDAKSWAYLKG
jgi:hypothetical protein